MTDALFEGINKAEPSAHIRIYYERDYRGPADDVAVFYGLEGNCPKIFTDFALNVDRRAVYVDLGFFGRRDGGRWRGYHKVSVNARHPVSYYRKPQHARARLDQLHLSLAPWRANGSHILLAGMSDKGAAAEGYAVEEWERWAIAELRRHSERPIIYRPKPSWVGAKPIPGTVFSGRERTAEADLQNAWAVVTHHSNVAIDGQLFGIPSFCWAGCAASMSLQDLALIESPWLPEGREDWLADIAWTQFSVQEMRDGLAWRHLRTEGLI